MKSKTWNNVCGGFCFECGFDEQMNLVNPDNEVLPEFLKTALLTSFPVSDFELVDCVFEIEIPFVSSGYDDPGVIYDFPENCYPPEYGDERLLDGVCVVDYYSPGQFISKTSKFLDKKVSQRLFELFEKEIMGVELEFD